ncbi:TPA: Rrf2 family transcriptional regulator [Klebsiella aerogenes]|nr:Rrf2 family transcriptional regulator [Klebsiella aerogenes]
MRISTRCQYAIQVTLLLARAEGVIPTSEMHQKLGISISYLEQLLATLRQHCLVEAVRGPGGGYQLTRPPDSITAEEIVRAFRTGVARNRLSGQMRCPDCGSSSARRPGSFWGAGRSERWPHCRPVHHINDRSENFPVRPVRFLLYQKPLQYPGLTALCPARA